MPEILKLAVQLTWVVDQVVLYRIHTEAADGAAITRPPNSTMRYDSTGMVILISGANTITCRWIIKDYNQVVEVVDWSPAATMEGPDVPAGTPEELSDLALSIMAGVNWQDEVLAEIASF